MCVCVCVFALCVLGVCFVFCVALIRMCVYVCMYACMCVCMCMHVCMYCMYVLYVCVYACMHVCVCVCVCVCLYLHVVCNQQYMCGCRTVVAICRTIHRVIGEGIHDAGT